MKDESPPWRRTWGRNLRAARLAAGMSQDALAKQVGMTQASVSFMEKGARPMSTETQVLVAAALKVTPAELFPTPTPRQVSYAR